MARFSNLRVLPSSSGCENRRPSGRRGSQWAFQGIETGIFGLLAAGLLAVTAYALVHRDA
jgi:hypothetical protein